MHFFVYIHLTTYKYLVIIFINFYATAFITVCIHEGVIIHTVGVSYTVATTAAKIQGYWIARCGTVLVE